MLMADIIRAGRGVNSVEAVRFLAEKGPEVVKELLIDDLRVDSTTSPGTRTRPSTSPGRGPLGEPDPLLGGQHGFGHRKGPGGSGELHPNIEIMTEATAVDLITLHHHSKDIQAAYQLDNRCLGAYVFMNRTGEVIPILAQYTVIATGGLGDIYLHTTNEKAPWGTAWSWPTGRARA
jgi:L-aspartate oxidase